MNFKAASIANLTHAMIGAVTPNWRVVYMQIDSNHDIILTFVFESDSKDDREEVDEVVFEFLALQPEHEVTSRIVIDSADRATYKFGDIIYARKEVWPE